MPALRSRKNGPRLRYADTRHPVPKHMDQPPDPEMGCGRQGCMAVWSSLPARRPTRDIARRRPVLRACALAVPRLCAHCATRCPRMCGAPNRAHGRRATSRGVGPYEDEPVCIPRFVYLERRARPSASAGAALPRRCATDARHRAAKARAEEQTRFFRTDGVGRDSASARAVSPTAAARHRAA